MALIDDFKARFPEFATATVDTYLPALEPLWPCYFKRGDYSDACHKEAILNLIAHLLVGESATSSATTRNTSSKSVGSVSVSYEQSSASKSRIGEMFMTTKYGQRFLLLTNGNYGGVAV